MYITHIKTQLQNLVCSFKNAMGCGWGKPQTDENIVLICGNKAMISS